MVVARGWFKTQGGFSAAGATTKMRLQICTEADYLRAHLTVIVQGSGGRNPALRDLKRRVRFILKKLLAGTQDTRKRV